MCLSAFNFLMILFYIHRRNQVKETELRIEQRFEVRLKYNFNDLIPNIDYEQFDDKKPHLPNEIRHAKIHHCIDNKAQNPKQRLNSLKLCLPLFREHIPKKNRESQKFIKDIPNYVAKYGEAGVVKMNYPFNFRI